MYRSDDAKQELGSAQILQVPEKKHLDESQRETAMEDGKYEKNITEVEQGLDPRPNADVSFDITVGELKQSANKQRESHKEGECIEAGHVVHTEGVGTVFEFLDRTEACANDKGAQAPTKGSPQTLFAIILRRIS